MSVKEKQETNWRYWRARAYKAHGRSAEANQLFAPISTEQNFYGRLALEDMGEVVEAMPSSYQPPKEDVDAMAQVPAFKRAIALYRVDMRLDGIREWAWGIARSRRPAVARRCRGRQALRRLRPRHCHRREDPVAARFLGPLSGAIPGGGARLRASGATGRGLGVRTDAPGKPLPGRGAIERGGHGSDATHASDGKVGGPAHRHGRLSAVNGDRHRNQHPARHLLPALCIRSPGQQPRARFGRLQRRSRSRPPVACRDPDGGRDLRRVHSR